MKKFFFVFLIMFPILVFGQSDSVNNGKPKAVFYHKAGNGQLIKSGELILVGKGTKGCNIEGFTMIIRYKTKSTCDSVASPKPLKSNSNAVTKEMLNKLNVNLGNTGCYHVEGTFCDIIWAGPDRQIYHLDNVSFTFK